MMCENARNDKYKQLENELREGYTKSPPDFQIFCNKVAEKAKQVTDASLALLYLTAEHKILEAVGRCGEAIEKLEPTQIPFYRLDWDIAPRYENIYDGFTAWAALHIQQDKVCILKWEELKKHRAHKGQWDPVVWKGSPETQLHAIMFAPLWLESHSKEYSHCLGFLKVELSQKDAPIGNPRYATPFNQKQEDELKNLGRWVSETFKNMSSEDRLIFWEWFVDRSGPQKVQHLMAVLRNWRSAEYNIIEGLGFVMEFFRMLAGAEHTIHILQSYHPWRETNLLNKKTDRIYVMPYWRPCWEKRTFHPQDALAERELIPIPAFRCSIPNEFNTNHRLTFFQPNDDSCIVLINSLMERGGSGAVRLADLKIRLTLNRKEDGKVFLGFEDSNTALKQPGIFSIDFSKAWLIELRAGHSDFGTIIIPKTEQNNHIKDEELGRKMASYAVSLARVLDRILGSEFGVQVGTCLPIHRPAGSRKLVTCFADIRNFSTVTRILRLMGQDKLAAIELFMEHYCRVIARIANKWGRLDKFLGDGVIILFGEDLLPTKVNDAPEPQSLVICNLTAICFVIAALRSFDEIQKVWLGDRLSPNLLPWRFPGGNPSSLLHNIKSEHCEDINMGLGVALNFGTIHMDYFGDTKGRSYSSIGDNVNLCSRICDEAGKYDYTAHKSRAPILITQPVFEYLKEFLTEVAFKRPPFRLQPRGLGLDYPIWELWPDDLQYGLVEQGFKDTRYLNIFKKTFIFANGKWGLTREFIDELALEDYNQ